MPFINPNLLYFPHQNMKAFKEAIRTNDHGLIYQLVKQVNINGTDRHCSSPMESPLLYAISLRKHQMVGILLQNGADPNKEMGGITPLCSACSQGVREVVQMLISEGADINKEDRQGATPLYIAISKNNLELANILVQKGADVNRINNYSGISLLMLAVSTDCYLIVDLLIHYGAVINLETSYGHSAVDLAGGKWMRDILRTALDRVWSPKTHSHHPRTIRLQIAMLMKLTHRNEDLGRIPKDVLFLICTFIASLSNHSLVK